MNRELTPQQIRARMDAGEKLRIVDVRTPGEFRRSHIPGSTNAPLGQKSAATPLAQAHETLVSVCTAGNRSRVACNQLDGTSEAHNLAGGIASWRAAGFELESEPADAETLTRQAHLAAGLILLAALVLANEVALGWVYLALLPTFGLLLHALTGICPMTLALKRMPWNS
ncbi:MAG: rhodanese-like domain-containing protein [Fimbriimonadaceae bacterium]|nr:rhodanese-like domain-containing protein [Fimbriimonadaceae bacterium]QYK56335.1 MAG: rhodanese-like domain-containing protein [Fimbriimonadaceae bacterium]